VYAITNVISHRQYIGSSRQLSSRFQRHASLLRRGKHHARRLQLAWNTYGEACFRFDVLERVSSLAALAAAEQRNIEAHKPSYNVAVVAVNHSALPGISGERLGIVVRELFSLSQTGEADPFLSSVVEAMVAGALRPGPNFHLLLQTQCTEASQNAG
jgi:hypothetical protein